ncbi:hypothetical protein [Microlunatus flavus]|uniref:Uncharacterized protein n=1 Tax=Microlunatus flavus TaxID=1036181 RepID=A0A1H9KIW2_9ACTN|nr:hypothetical protein [Microlunatus flavus]SEQ99076.1 hypothetical protein SAMN05421756_107239 [Microlunatus flavus]
MTGINALGARWLRLGLPIVVVPEAWEPAPAPRAVVGLRVACPHCTNTDTLSRHCRDNRCGWVSCTCGALVYSRRRHRHPRHGSSRDTCHDPAAAA